MGAIKTVGFTQLEPAKQQDVNRRIEHYVSQYKRKIDSFDELNISLKEVHKASEKANPVFEINANLISGGDRIHGHAEEFDLITGVNSALTTIESQMRVK